MFTGSAEELKKAERKAQAYAEEIAALLNKLDQLIFVRVAPGRILTQGAVIRSTGKRWVVDK